MAVHFIGAGPGAADLITLRGKTLIEHSQLCLYAGSLVPPEVLSWCPPTTRQINTAPMDLEGIMAEMQKAHAAGEEVARLQSGDLSIWSAAGEQMRRLHALNIPYTVTPGVPAFAAASAALKCELTLPEVAQTVVLTRMPGRASAMPSGEKLRAYAATKATLALHLSIGHLAEVVQTALPYYGEDCPIAIVYRVSWPDEEIIQSSLGAIEDEMAERKIARTALILIGPALGGSGPKSALQTSSPRKSGESQLYNRDYVRRYRAGWTGDPD